MQAVAHELLERNPRTRVTFVGTEQFTNEFIGALQGRTTPSSGAATARPTCCSSTTCSS
jgi:hypothetical protein